MTHKGLCPICGRVGDIELRDDDARECVATHADGEKKHTGQLAEFVSVNMAAQLLGVQSSAVYGAIRNGRIAVEYPFGAGRIFIRPLQIREYMQSVTHGWPKGKPRGKRGAV